MKAIIMAGGEGTRLRPLTCDQPKPMMRIMDRPIMDLSLELLARHGVTEAAVTLGYLPERIRDHFGDSCRGISLSYFVERQPLGTAGGVKQAAKGIDGTFCVLSGDGVTDTDLTRAYEFHKSTGSPATMILKRLADPTEYGLVITAADGRVVRFVEKPAWGEVVSDTINTGIYIFEPEILDLIPDGEYDFGKKLLPRLASEGKLFGWVSDGYWCDIGDVAAYTRMCRDALDGAIDLASLAAVGISPAATVSSSAVIETPCYIGPGAHIASGAHIHAHSIIGANVRIDAHADIKRSIIWHGCHIMEGAQLRGCVLSAGVTVKPCARVYENCALGTGAIVGADAEVAPGVSIWPGKSVCDAGLASANLVWGSRSASCFHGGALPVSSPTDALRAAQAYAAALAPREILLGRTPCAEASAAWYACASALMAHGVHVLDAGVCTEPQLRFAMDLMGADGGILTTESSIIPLETGGLRISHSARRSICAYMTRQDFPQPFSAGARLVTNSGRSAQAYIAMLAAAFTADTALAPAAAVHCENQHVLDIAEQVFSRIGLAARFEWEDELMELFPGEIGIWLSPDGASAQFSHGGGMLTAPQNELLIAWTALERGENTIVMPERTTRAVTEIAARRNAAVLPADTDSERALRSYPTQLRLHTDGIFLAVCALSALTENALALTGWLSTMPKVSRAEKRVPLKDSDRGRVLRSLTESLVLERENARAWFVPDDSRQECCVVAESRDMEVAGELCDICAAELLRASSSPE